MSSPTVKVFRSETCRRLLSLALEEARDIERGSDDVRYDADERVLRLSDDPARLTITSERAAELLGGDDRVELTFNDPAVAETERCCFLDKIRLAEELGRLLVQRKFEEFAERVRGLSETARVELSGDPEYEPVALRSPLTQP